MFDDAWTKAGDGGDGFTYPSGTPAKRIDYLWIRQGAPLRVVRAWVPRSAASDHLPVVAELQWTR
jgi:endonuclease/exonuclease/phosphatase family metal-dependent hydrolase